MRQDRLDLCFPKRRLRFHARPSVVGSVRSLGAEFVVPRLRGSFGRPVCLRRGLPVDPATARAPSTPKAPSPSPRSRPRDAAGSAGAGSRRRGVERPLLDPSRAAGGDAPPAGALPRRRRGLRRGDRHGDGPRAGDQASERHPPRRPEGRRHPRRGSRRPGRARNRHQRERAGRRSSRPRSTSLRRRSSSRPAPRSTALELLVELLFSARARYDRWVASRYGYVSGRPSLPAKSRATAANDEKAPPGAIREPARRQAAARDGSRSRRRSRSRRPAR